MMTVIEPPSALSSPQRRSQVLLMFYLPGQSVTPQQLVRLNQVDEATAQQDIAETGREIQRYHRLTLASQMDGSYRIEGAALDQRLCLLHALRRGLRLCPHFVHHHFTPALKTQLKQQGQEKLFAGVGRGADPPLPVADDFGGEVKFRRGLRPVALLTGEIRRLAQMML
ncbi:hypothetical protein A3N69_11510 [Klebsiella aerogenes]|nr:hypothetical protein A3N69_11510 [Klebsiella aerogenes]